MWLVSCLIRISYGYNNQCSHGSLLYIHTYIHIYMHAAHEEFYAIISFQVHGATISGQIAVPNSNTYGLQKTLPNSPLSDILLEDVSSLEKSHSRCFTLEHCSATLQQQVFLMISLRLVVDNA